jgi:YD repeat-containing protein
MTDVETLLRSRLHDELDGIAPSTLTAQGALRAGQQARRRRTAMVSVTAVLALLTGVTAGVGLMRHDTSRTDSVVASGRFEDRTVGYANQFRAGNFTGIRADMTPAVRSQLSEETLRSTWQLAMDDLGPLVRITAPVLESSNPATYLMPLHFRSGDANMRVTYDSSGAVIGVTLLSVGVEQLPTAPRALEAAARQVVDDMVSGHFASVRNRFDATMTRKLSTAELASAWRQVAVDKHGGFVSTGGVTATAVRGNTVIDVFCTMHSGELKVRVAFDEQERISGLFLLEP